MDVDQAVAKLKQHRVWAEAAVRFCGSNRELLEDTQRTIELGESIYRQAIMEVADAEGASNKTLKALRLTALADNAMAHQSGQTNTNKCEAFRHLRPAKRSLRLASV
ncbi:MAG: hypothetical protein WB689_04370 [Xanthobacteraceae bacterium]